MREKKEEFGNVADSEWQVSLKSDQIPRKLREINSSMVSRLFSVSGIIISTTKPYIKACKLKIKCRSCMQTKII